ncbi:MAG: hypothetical protein GY773_06875, partial [Actinomycetia bacterium]|nr:hypothetical protein [Actinomycetes bacterium]
SLITIAVGAVLVGIGWAIERALGDGAKEPTIPTMAVVGAAIAVVVGLLWVIELPVVSEDPDVAKVFEPIASSTAGPWTILAGVGFLAYFLGLWLRRFIPEGRAKGILTGLWLLSFPIITLGIINDPGFSDQHAPEFDLTTYLLVGAGFLIIGGFAIALASYPSIGEWSAAISGLIAILIIFSWITSMLMIIRFLLVVTLL